MTRWFWSRPDVTADEVKRELEDEQIKMIERARRLGLRHAQLLTREEGE